MKKMSLLLLVIITLMVVGCAGGRGSVGRIHPGEVIADRNALSQTYEDYFKVGGQEADVRMINFIGDKSLLNRPLLGVPKEFSQRVPVTVVPINPDQTGKKEMSRLGETPVNSLVTPGLNRKLARLLMAAGFNVRSLEGGIGGVLFYQYLLNHKYLLGIQGRDISTLNPYTVIDQNKAMLAKIGFISTATSLTYENFNDLSVRIRGVGPKAQKFDLYIELTMDIVDLETGLLYGSVVFSGVIRGTSFEFGATRWIQSGSVGDTLLDLHVGANTEAQIDKSYEILMAHAIKLLREEMDGVLWKLMKKDTDTPISTLKDESKPKVVPTRPYVRRKPEEIFTVVQVIKHETEN